MATATTIKRTRKGALLYAAQALEDVAGVMELYDIAIEVDDGWRNFVRVPDYEPLIQFPGAGVNDTIDAKTLRVVAEAYRTEAATL